MGLEALDYHAHVLKRQSPEKKGRKEATAGGYIGRETRREKMMQYPWSTRIIPTSYLLPAQWPLPQSDELLLAMEESDYEDKCNEIRKAGSNLTVIGKTTVENDKEEFDNDADDDDADNAEESEGDEFEQETG